MIGHEAHALRDEARFAARDPRLTYDEVVVRGDHGEAVAQMPVVSISRIEHYSAELRAQVGLDDLRGPVALVGGGLANLCAVAWTEDRDSDVRRGLVASMVAEATSRSIAEGRRPVAIYVSRADLDAYAGSGQRRSAPAPLGPWWTLPLGSAGTLTEFVERLDRQTRKVWRRDLRAAASGGWEVAVAPYDQENIARATPMVAAVSANNQFPEPDTMARWRLEGYADRPGDHFFVCAKRAGRTETYTACRRFGDFLEAHTIGISTDVADRRAAYHFGSFTAPALVAFDAGIREIGYGPGHAWPKRSRGCVGDDRLVLHLGAVAGSAEG